ncbi:MAG: hypothetical protein KDK78_10770, partial [Chlamydiia bacterium]|nr:hypothetical protein [Chlamydiia bacterium]
MDLSDVEKKDLEDYLVEPEKLAVLQQPEKVMELMQNGQTMQDILGFKDEVLMEFYEIASDFFDEERYEDALNAFVFLSSVNSYIPEFWIAMGMTQERLMKFNEAFQSYSMAAMVSGPEILAYQMAVECADKIDTPQRVSEILDI